MSPFVKFLLPLAAAAMLVGCLTESDPGERVVYVGGPDTAALARDGQTLNLRFLGRFGSDTLKTGRKYAASRGDSVRFVTAKFYVSGIALVDSTGGAHPLIGTHLVDLLDSGAQARGYAVVSVKALPGRYRGLRFSVGVPFDENHRDPATQAAPLGMSSDMFWSWNSGYIFHRVEGKADSAGVEKSFAYHVGTDNSRLEVNFFSLTDTSKAVTIAGHHKVAAVDGLTKAGHEVETHLSIQADYKQLFGTDTATALRPSVNASERVSHGMGALANRVYLNTQSIFSLGAAASGMDHP